MALDRFEQFFLERNGGCDFHVLLFAYPSRPLSQQDGIVPFGTPRGIINQPGSNEQIDMDILSSGNSFAKTVAPS
jgi:hypothetical protein